MHAPIQSRHIFTLAVVILSFSYGTYASAEPLPEGKTSSEYVLSIKEILPERFAGEIPADAPMNHTAYQSLYELREAYSSNAQRFEFGLKTIESQNFQLSEPQAKILGAQLANRNSFPDGWRSWFDSIESDVWKMIYPQEERLRSRQGLLPSYGINSATGDLVAELIEAKDWQDNGMWDGEIIRELVDANFGEREIATVRARIAALQKGTAGVGFTAKLKAEIEDLKFEAVKDGTAKRNRLARTLREIRDRNEKMAPGNEDVNPLWISYAIRTVPLSEAEDKAFHEIVDFANTRPGRSNGFSEQSLLHRLFNKETETSAIGLELGVEILKDQRLKDEQFRNQYLFGVEPLVEALFEHSINAEQAAAIRAIRDNVIRNPKSADNNGYVDFDVATLIAKAPHFDMVKRELVAEFLNNWPRSIPNRRSAYNILKNFLAVDRLLSEAEVSEIRARFNARDFANLQVFIEALPSLEEQIRLGHRDYRPTDASRAPEIVTIHKPVKFISGGDASTEGEGNSANRVESVSGN